MNERIIEERMCRLIDKLQALPKQHLDSLEDLCSYEDGQLSSVEESVAKLHNSLDYLRLSVKYMVFDLEATRRENVYLRKLVEQIRRDSSRRNDSDGSDEFYGENGAD